MKSKKRFNRRLFKGSLFLILIFALCLSVDLNAQTINRGTDKEENNTPADMVESKWKEYYQRGIDYKKEKKYEKAIEEFNKALDVIPGFWLTFMQLGDANRELKQYEKAIHYYTEAIKKGPDPPFYVTIYQLRSISYAGLQRFQDAMSDITKAIELDPKRSDAYYKRGLYYLLEFDQPERALKDFDRAITLGEGSALIYNDRGTALKKLGRFQEAAESYSTALKISPSYSRSLLNRGFAYICLGEYDKALEDENAILRHNPDEIDALIQRISIYFWKKDLKSALSDLNLVLKHGHRTPWTYLALSRAYYGLGELDKAVEANEKGIALKGREDFQSDLYLEKGFLLLLKGHSEEALRAYNEGINLAINSRELFSIQRAIADLSETSFNKKEAKNVIPQLLDRLQEAQRNVAPLAKIAPGECHKSRI